MPYLTRDQRVVLDSQLNEVEFPLPMQYPPSAWSAGALNYIITRIVLLFLGKAAHYERFNAAIGVLESAKLELYRRMVAPYEDTKKERNGDVY